MASGAEAQDIVASGHPRPSRWFGLGILAALVLLAAPALADHEATGTYAQPTVNHTIGPVFDVLLVPAPHGDLAEEEPPHVTTDTRQLTPANSYTEAMAKAVAVWEPAVEQAGDSAFADAFDVRLTIASPGTSPSGEWDVVLSTSESGYAGGVAWPMDEEPCPAVVSTVQAETFLHPTAVQHVAAHEVGHCLGLHHSHHPTSDLMSDTPFVQTVGAPAVSPRTTFDVLCPSNLNVYGLEHLYPEISGHGSPGTNATIPVEDYALTDCNPHQAPPAYQAFEDAILATPAR